MLTVRRVVAVGLIIAGATMVVAALVSSETDEEAVARQLRTLADAVGIQEGEGLLYRRARLNAVFADVLDENARVDAPELGPPERGRNAITMLATRAGTLYQAGRVDLHAVDIRVNESHSSAEVASLASLTASGSAEVIRREDRRVVFELDKRDGDWRVQRIAVAPPGE